MRLMFLMSGKAKLRLSIFIKREIHQLYCGGVSTLPHCGGVSNSTTLRGSQQLYYIAGESATLLLCGGVSNSTTLRRIQQFYNIAGESAILLHCGYNYRPSRTFYFGFYLVTSYSVIDEYYNLQPSTFWMGRPKLWLWNDLGYWTRL